MKLKYIPQLNSLRIGIILTLLMLGVIYKRPMFMEQLEARAYDIRFGVRGEQPGTDQIVVVAMDDQSIEKLGRWPWPRNYWSVFFRNIRNYQPRVIALDVVFSEPDPNLNLNFLKTIQEKYLELTAETKSQEKPAAKTQSQTEPDPFIPFLQKLEADSNTDLSLAQALGEVKNVILGWFFYEYREEAEQIGQEENERRMNLVKPFALKILQFKQGADLKLLASHIPDIQGFQVNLPIFTEKISGSGYFTFLADTVDGVYRHGNLLAGYPPFDPQKPLDFYAQNYTVFPSLSLETLRLYLDQTPAVVVDPVGVQQIKLGQYRIPVNEAGMVMINYRGGISSFKTVSFADLVDDFEKARKDPNFDPLKIFKDKIVLVGPTAVGIYDIRATPFGALPGVLLHANIIDNVLQNRALYRPSWMWGFDLIAIAILGILLSVIYPKVKPVFSGAFALALALGYLVANYYIFNNLHYSLTIVYPVSSLLVVYMGITLYHYTMEEREKRFIRNTFSVYLSPAVISDLLHNPEKLKLGGENKRLTIFFSDIAGFTSISEKLPTEQLVPLLNQYLSEMSDIVLKHRGTVDKYIGDAVMAIFGAPVDYPDHAKSACLAALEMQERLIELNKKWKAEGFPPINCRIGLNTGMVKVGNMGSTKRMDYTVIGDEVNLASRLEGANKAYGTNFMVSESTYNDAREVIEARELDLLAVVGKQKPVRVYQVLARKGQLDQKTRELVRTFEQALKLYREARFTEALELFNNCLEINPADSPSQLYRERCLTFLQNPPPRDWDGVFRLTKK